MARRYREHAPPAHLAPYVECFWTLGPGEALPEYPVLPDGCADIVCSPGAAADVQVVGTMTRARNFVIPAGGFACGVRFHPAMSRCFFPVPGEETTDRSIPLAEVSRSVDRRLGERIAEAGSASECISLLEACLHDPSQPGVVQRVCAFMVERGGEVRIDDAAFEAGMSARQLRRVFIEQLGLSPKHFCRVIRFRRSVAGLARVQRGDWTQLALDCGYYDQAHFINEFHELSGYSPGEFSKLAR